MSTILLRRHKDTKQFLEDFVPWFLCSKNHFPLFYETSAREYLRLYSNGVNPVNRLKTVLKDFTSWYPTSYMILEMLSPEDSNAFLAASTLTR